MHQRLDSTPLTPQLLSAITSHPFHPSPYLTTQIFTSQPSPVFTPPLTPSHPSFYFPLNLPPILSLSSCSCHLSHPHHIFPSNPSHPPSHLLFPSNRVPLSPYHLLSYPFTPHIPLPFRLSPSLSSIHHIPIFMLSHSHHSSNPLSSRPSSPILSHPSLYHILLAPPPFSFSPIPEGEVAEGYDEVSDCVRG